MAATTVYDAVQWGKQIAALSHDTTCCVCRHAMSEALSLSLCARVCVWLTTCFLLTQSVLEKSTAVLAKQ